MRAKIELQHVRQHDAHGPALHFAVVSHVYAIGNNRGHELSAVASK